jgi:ComF family protein
LARVLAGRVPCLNASSLYIFEKSGRVQKLLHSIKYQGQKDLATYLGKLYAGDLLSEDGGNDFDFIVPVPLHPSKLRQRGFNQSEYFARGLAEGLDKRLETEKMIRKVATKTQTRKKKFERWENVEGIFELEDKDFFANKHVLLVDDVITTGATLEAAWQCLKDVEGIKISVASIAFANS